jgi:hypothetical protein
MGIFDNIKQIQSWKKSKAFLLKAKSFISVNLLDEAQLQTLKDFDDFLEYNELGLAFDQFVYLSEDINFPAEFWSEMLLAAKEMKLEDEVKRCESYLE